MVAARFGQGAEMAQTFGGPKLAGAFEAALSLPTRGLYRAGANRPTAPLNRPVIHAAGVGHEIVLFASHHFSRRPARDFQRGDLPQHLLLLPVAQLVATRFDPLRGGRLVVVQGPAQLPEVLAGVIEVQHLGCSSPAVLGHVPNPRGPVGHHQLGAGAAQPAAQGFPVQAAA